MSYPEEYPIILQLVSWTMNDVHGIYARWNKYCNAGKKNPYFFQNLLTSYVSREYFKMGNVPKEVFNLIRYICDCITIKYNEQQQEFTVSLKKIKQNQKMINKFNEEDFKKHYQDAMLTKDQAKQFIKNCILFLKNEYNRLLKNCAKNKQKQNTFLE